MVGRWPGRWRGWRVLAFAQDIDSYAVIAEVFNQGLARDLAD